VRDVRSVSDALNRAVAPARTEREGRAQPRPFAARLAALAAADGISGQERLEARLLQGWLLAGLSDQAGTEAAAHQLERAAEAGAPSLSSAASSPCRHQFDNA
jgi:hypothetical protein